MLGVGWYSIVALVRLRTKVYIWSSLFLCLVASTPCEDPFLMLWISNASLGKEGKSMSSITSYEVVDLSISCYSLRSGTSLTFIPPLTTSTVPGTTVIASSWSNWHLCSRILSISSTTLHFGLDLESDVLPPLVVERSSSL